MLKITIITALFFNMHLANAFQAELLTKVTEAVKSARASKVPINTSHIDFLKAPEYAEAIKPIGDSTKVENVVSNLGDKLHATWQTEARASGKTERFKPIKVDGKTITSEADLQKYLDKNNIPAEYRKRFKIGDVSFLVESTELLS